MAKAKLPTRTYSWSPELAYVVGLLVTDGCLSSDGRHITMRSVDKQLLEAFAQCVQRSGVKEELTVDAQRNRVEFSHVQFYRWLQTIGLTPAKTYTIGPIDIPDQYIIDFLRGHLDGDGSIRLYEDRYNTYRGRNYSTIRLYTVFLSASQDHIIWLQRKIKKIAGIQGAIIKRPPATRNRVPMWMIKFAKKESVELLNQIYYTKDLPSLKRKEKIATNALGAIAKQKRRQYQFVRTRSVA